MKNDQQLYVIMKYEGSILPFERLISHIRHDFYHNNIIVPFNGVSVQHGQRVQLLQFDIVWGKTRENCFRVKSLRRTRRDYDNNMYRYIVYYIYLCSPNKFLSWRVSV